MLSGTLNLAQLNSTQRTGKLSHTAGKGTRLAYDTANMTINTNDIHNLFNNNNMSANARRQESNERPAYYPLKQRHHKLYPQTNDWLQYSFQCLFTDLLRCAIPAG